MLRRRAEMRHRLDRKSNCLSLRDEPALLSTRPSAPAIDARGATAIFGDPET